MPGFLQLVPDNVAIDLSSRDDWNSLYTILDSQQFKEFTPESQQDFIDAAFEWVGARLPSPDWDGFEGVMGIPLEDEWFKEKQDAFLLKSMQILSSQLQHKEWIGLQPFVIVLRLLADKEVQDEFARDVAALLEVQLKSACWDGLGVYEKVFFEDFSEESKEKFISGILNLIRSQLEDAKCDGVNGFVASSIYRGLDSEKRKEFYDLVDDVVALQIRDKQWGGLCAVLGSRLSLEWGDERTDSLLEKAALVIGSELKAWNWNVLRFFVNNESYSKMPREQLFKLLSKVIASLDEGDNFPQSDQFHNMLARAVYMLGLVDSNDSSVPIVLKTFTIIHDLLRVSEDAVNKNLAKYCDFVAAVCNYSIAVHYWDRYRKEKCPGLFCVTSKFVADLSIVGGKIAGMSQLLDEITKHVAIGDYMDNIICGGEAVAVLVFGVLEGDTRGAIVPGLYDCDKLDDSLEEVRNSEDSTRAEVTTAFNKLADSPVNRKKYSKGFLQDQLAFFYWGQRSVADIFGKFSEYTSIDDRSLYLNLELLFVDIQKLLRRKYIFGVEAAKDELQHFSEAVKVNTTANGDGQDGNLIGKAGKFAEDLVRQKNADKDKEWSAEMESKVQWVQKRRDDIDRYSNGRVYIVKWRNKGWRRMFYKRPNLSAKDSFEILQGYSGMPGQGRVCEFILGRRWFGPARWKTFSYKQFVSLIALDSPDINFWIEKNENLQFRILAIYYSIARNVKEKESLPADLLTLISNRAVMIMLAHRLPESYYLRLLGSLSGDYLAQVCSYNSEPINDYLKKYFSVKVETSLIVFSKEKIPRIPEYHEYSRVGIAIGVLNNVAIMKLFASRVKSEAFIRTITLLMGFSFKEVSDYVKTTVDIGFVEESKYCCVRGAVGLLSNLALMKLLASKFGKEQFSQFVVDYVALSFRALTRLASADMADNPNSKEYYPIDIALSLLNNMRLMNLLWSRIEKRQFAKLIDTVVGLMLEKCSQRFVVQSLANIFLRYFNSKFSLAILHAFTRHQAIMEAAAGSWQEEKYVSMLWSLSTEHFLRVAAFNSALINKMLFKDYNLQTKMILALKVCYQEYVKENQNPRRKQLLGEVFASVLNNWSIMQLCRLSFDRASYSRLVSLYSSLTQSKECRSGQTYSRLKEVGIGADADADADGIAMDDNMPCQDVAHYLVPSAPEVKVKGSSLEL